MAMGLQKEKRLHWKEEEEEEDAIVVVEERRFEGLRFGIICMGKYMCVCIYTEIFEGQRKQRT